ncbi:MAG TPA: hypothetical protein VNU47_02220 [Candidatus Paceibacterota bacterium]|nr:hypothetical protein [Candidatus Paceibacterota bacterium]
MNEDLNRLETLLKDTLEVAEENNRLLREMRRMGRISFWSKVIIWALVLIIPMLFIGPILDSFGSFMSGDTAGSIMGFPSPEMIQEAMELYQAQ